MPLTRIDSAFLDLDAIGGIDFDVQSGVPTFTVDATTHRVGIGTDNPSSALNVIGEIKVGSSDEYSVDTSRVQHNTRITSPLFTGRGIDGYVDIKGDTDATSFIRVLDSGNVGIGTDNPSKTLSILSSQSVMLQLESTSATARIGFKVPNTTNSPTIGVSDNEDIQFRAGGNERLRITSSGNVGIGTTNPAYPLHMHSSSGLVTVSGVGGVVNSTQRGFRAETVDLSGSTGNVGVYLSAPYNSGTANAGFFRVKRGTSNIYNGTEIATNTQFRILTSLTEDTSEALRINSSGAVGIGTTNPSTKLHVYGDSANILIAAASGVGKLRLTRGATATEIYASTSLSYIGTTSDTPFGIRSNNIEGIRVDSAGSVGIGAIPETSLSSDTKQLKVGGLTYIRGTNGTVGKQNFFTGITYNGAPLNSGGDKAIVSNAGGDFLPAQYAMYQGAHRWRNATSATAGEAIAWVDQMIINSVGNVGIGTNNPGSKLHVENAIDHSSTDYLNSDAIIHVQNTSGTGRSTIKLEGEATFTYGAGSNTLRIRDRQNLRAIIDSSGNVGIGTDNPASRFEVRNGGTNAISGTLFSGGFTQTITAGEPQIAFISSIDGTGNPSGTEAARGGIGFSWANASDRTRFIVGTNSDLPVRIYTNNSEKVRVNADGNVGIGTTNPTNKLQVEGHIQSRGISPGASGGFTSSHELKMYAYNVTNIPDNVSFNVTITFTNAANGPFMLECYSGHQHYRGTLTYFKAIGAYGAHDSSTGGVSSLIVEQSGNTGTVSVTNTSSTTQRTNNTNWSITFTSTSASSVANTSLNCYVYVVLHSKTEPVSVTIS